MILVVLFMVLCHSFVIVWHVVCAVCVFGEGDQALVCPLFHCLPGDSESLGGHRVGLIVPVYFPEGCQAC